MTTHTEAGARGYGVSVERCESPRSSSLARITGTFALVLLLALTLLAASSSPDPAAAGHKLLAEAIKAAGGQKAVDAVDHVTYRGVVTATVAGAGVTGSVTMSEARDGSSRDEMDVGGMTMLTVVGPNGAHSSEAGIPKTYSGDELVQAQAQAKFSPLGLLMHGNESGVALRALAAEDGLDVLEVTPPKADPITFYLDAKTHFVTKVKLADKDGSVVTDYALYRPEAGVQMAHRMTIAQTGMTMDIVFDDVQVNGAGESEAGAAAATPPPSAAVASHDVKIVNRTGKTLTELHQSEAGEKDWGRNLLPVDKLHDGDTVKIGLAAPKGCAGDLMVGDDDGTMFVVPGAVLCTNASLVLSPGKRGHLVAQPK